jgi:folate-binding protein YgfZ
MPGTLEHARQARRDALVAVLDASAPTFGTAKLGLLRAEGPDAASFLHSQLTNDVSGLEPGQGNLTARVSRTGHLEHLASLHRELRRKEPHPSFLLLTERDRLQGLHDALDAFLFSDVLTMTPLPAPDVLAVQGPKAAEVYETVFGPLGFEPWGTLPEHGIRPVKRTRKTVGAAIGAGSFVVRRSLTGDVGFLVFLADGTDLAALTSAFEHVVSPADFCEAVELLRVEAGLLHLDTELTGKRRLLPETGVEQKAVSYTKGCYLGQEVIARVRTYGSVPNLLRAIVLDGDDATLGRLPAPGEPLTNADGKKVGTIASRSWSVEREAPIALAYLGRNHRTPGTELSLTLDDGPLQGTVEVLPLYASPDTAARVQHLYDRAIRVFADGDVTTALALLEESLGLDPSFADAYEVIGVILGKAGQYHEAIDFFRRLEEVAPNEPLVNTNLSLYYMKIGDRDTAEDEAGKATLKSMAKARGKEGGDVDADLRASKRKDAERKLRMFGQVLEFDDVDPIALFGMGSSLLTLERWEEAAGYLERAAVADKQNSAVYVAHGRALEKLDRADDAVATYRAGIEVASRRGDLMPLKEMEHRLLLMGVSRR